MAPSDATRSTPPRGFRTYWPWFVILLAFSAAAWHVLDFEEDIDPEFPVVERPIFSHMPPAAYRLAEPGDTLDRIMIYLSAAMLVITSSGAIAARAGALWPSAVAMAIAAFWYAITPGPTVDGWHGLGWRAIFNPAAPMMLRAALSSAVFVLAILVLSNLSSQRAQLRLFWDQARQHSSQSLWIVAAILAACRQFEIPGVEPAGYWPRCAMVLAMIAADLALLGDLHRLIASRRLRIRILVASPAVWFAFVAAGVAVTWYHRPLARFKVVEPGRIYISAMPTKRGLEVANSRHHFRTIINLFPEETVQRSSLLPDELAFVREHGIRYVASPSSSSESVSNAFLDKTLQIAQDPSAWPILIHCHGCMDRSPAWMGIYRFVVQRRPLDEIMREIERHRGYRPKASVTLLYNRVLPPRAPDHYWSDPTASLLRHCAHGTVDPLLATSRSPEAEPIAQK